MTCCCQLAGTEVCERCPNNKFRNEMRYLTEQGQIDYNNHLDSLYKDTGIQLFDFKKSSTDNRGCEYCSGEQNEIFKRDNKWYMRVEGITWDDYNDCFEYTDVEIIYCPMCGRKLN